MGENLSASEAQISGGGFSRKLPVFIPLLGALLLLAGMITVLYLVRSPQDIRRGAQEAEQKVKLVFVPSGTPLRAETLSAISMRMNTNGEAIDGIQVVMDVKSDAFAEMTLKLEDVGGLRRVWEQIQDIDGGKRVSFAYTSADPARPFVSNSNVDLGELVFTAGSTGRVEINFDPNWTKANKHRELVNVLNPIFALDYEIASAPALTPPLETTESPSTGSGSSSEKGGAELGGAGVMTDGVAMVVAAGTGVCNADCLNSTECAKGFICYQNQCRQEGNVESVTCELSPTVGVKACDEACSAHGECSGGLSCYEGRCREGSNPKSSLCRPASELASGLIADLCLNACLTNADCGEGLACFKRECRLATNTDSESCDPGDSSAVDFGSGEATGAAVVAATPVPEDGLIVSSSENQGPSLASRVFRGLLFLGVIVGVIGILAVILVWVGDRKRGALPPPSSGVVEPQSDKAIESQSFKASAPQSGGSSEHLTSTGPTRKPGSFDPSRDRGPGGLGPSTGSTLRWAQGDAGSLQAGSGSDEASEEKKPDPEVGGASKPEATGDGSGPSTSSGQAGQNQERGGDIGSGLEAINKARGLSKPGENVGGDKQG